MEEKGASTLCLRALARKAGVSHTAPYRHFKDKNDLLKSLVIQGYDLLISGHLSAKTTKGLPKEKLFLAMSKYVEFGLAYPQLHQLIFAEQKAYRPDKEVAQRGVDCFNEFVKIVDNALPKNKRVDARFIAFALWSHAHGVLLLTPNSRHNSEEAICSKSGENFKGYMKSLRYGMEALIAGSFGQKWKNPYLF